MNYEQLLSKINNQIVHGKDTTEIGRFRHLKTALSNVIKLNEIDDDNIGYWLTTNIDSLLDVYKEKLKAEKKSDIRGPLSRVRRLSEYYRELTEIDVDNLSFSEILQKAFLQMYGEQLYTKAVKPEEMREIRAKYITYSEACKRLIKAGVSECPEHWEINGKIKNKELAGRLRNWITGDVVPTASRLPKGRINFIENYLGLPTDLLWNKIVSLKSATHKRPIKERALKKSRDQNKPKNFRVKKLNDNLKLYFEEYRDYKVDGEKPEPRNIPEGLSNNRSALLRLSVRELYKGEEQRWTKGNNGKNGSLNKFMYCLKGFMNYCVVYLGMDENDVSVSDLTNPDVISKMHIAASKGVIGGSVVRDIYSLIRGSISSRGYLRLCGDKGERTIEEYNVDLDFILDEIPIWITASKKTIAKRGDGSDKGKQNIKFLMDMPKEERVECWDKSVSIMMNKAEANLKEAEDSFYKSGKTKSITQRHKHLRMERNFIDRAYKNSIAALMFGISKFVAPRVAVWPILKYYDSVASQDPRYPSLTYHRHKNCYKLEVPLYGPSLVDENDVSRYIKNADAQFSVPIELYLPEKVTPLIKSFLSVRKVYIDKLMPSEVEQLIERTSDAISDISSGNSNFKSENIKSRILSELNKDLAIFENFEKNDVELLIPKTTFQKDLRKVSEDELIGQMEDPIFFILRAEKRHFIYDKTNLGSNFKYQTADAFDIVCPNSIQDGVNIHAVRHLSASTYLEFHKGDYTGAASILNDTEEQVHRVYGPKDKRRAMQELTNIEY